MSGSNALFEPAWGDLQTAPARVNPVAPPTPLAASPTPADAYRFDSDAAQAWLDAQRRQGVAEGTINPDTGWPTQQAIAQIPQQYAMGMIGGTKAPEMGAAVNALAPEGALAARMARAQAMGFDTSKTLYHATHRDFDAFRLNMAGSGSNAGNVEKAVFLTSDPKVAETYLPQTWVNAQSPSVIEAMGRHPGDVTQYFGPGSQIMPLHVRNPDNFEVWDMGGGSYTPDFMRQALKEAKTGGAPGVIFQNMADPGIGSLGRPKPSDIYAVFKPSDIRGKFADFDPKKAKSSALTAGIAGVLAGGGAAGAAREQP